MKIHYDQKGFTLIEVMIATVISGIIIGAAVMVFTKMQSSSANVDQRSVMATTSRGAMYLIEDNIRLLGFNPQKNISANNLVDTATGAFLSFSRNNVSDPLDLVAPFGDAIDTVSIGLNAANDIDGGGRDGFADHGATSLVIGGGNVADDIEAIRFAYAYDDDDDGNVEVSANNNILWAIDSDDNRRLDTLLDTDDDGDIDLDDTVGGSAMASQVDISRIRAVKVWLVVRSSEPVRGAKEQYTMVVGDQRYPINDDYSHTLFTTTIRCRNKS